MAGKRLNTLKNLSLPMEFDELIKKANDLLRKGGLEEAMKTLKEAENLADTSEKKARVMREMARISIMNGDFYKGESMLQDALRILRDSKDRDVITQIYTSLIDLYHRMGDINAVNRYVEKGGPFAEEAEDEIRFGFYNICAIVSFDQGRIGIAHKYWEKCMEIARKMNDNELLAISLNNIGEIYRIRGEYEKALDYYKKAYEYSQKSENYTGMSVNLLNMGDVEHNRGNLDAAEEYLRKSVQLYEKHKNKVRLSASYLHLSKVLADKRKFDEAIKNGNKAYTLAEEIKSKIKMGESLMAIGYAYFKMKKYGDALKNYNGALKIFSEIGNRVAVSECELAMGETLILARKCDSAKYHLERAKTLAKEMKEYRIVQKANLLLSKC